MALHVGLDVSLKTTSICVAVARKLAIIMHRMWVEKSEFRFGQLSAAQTA
jgi:hypothetical protein